MNIPFSPPDIGEDEIKAVVEALKSGWITTGPRTKALENEALKYTSTSKTVCLNSQTAAAELTLRILGLGPGDEVITSAYTYTATASIVEHVGAKLVLVDTQKNSLEMDYDSLECLINDKTKVIIPVDLAGIPCDYDRIFDIVNNKKSFFKPNNKLQEVFGRVIVVADTAHSFGAKYKGKKIGSVADFSNFSFHAVKNLTTAEGGLATWKDKYGLDNGEIYRKYQLMSLHGQSKDALSKNKMGSWEYDVIGPWYKCNMTDVLASIGLSQIKRYDSMLKRRREIIEKYDSAFKPIGIEVLDHFTENHTSSGHLYITRIPNIQERERNEIIMRMGKKSIACNVHYKPLPILTAYKNLGFKIEDYPNAYNLYKNEITLPLHTKLSDEEVSYVIENYSNIVKEFIK